METAETTETISFIQNTALDYGGAISLANPDELNLTGVIFTFNEAGFGGAVALASTVWAPAQIQRCSFEYNNATNGGAMYLSGVGQTLLQGSFFRYNVAGEVLLKFMHVVLCLYSGWGC